MLEIIQYATSGFWVFIGCFLLLLAAGELVTQLIKAFFLMIQGFRK